jgi:predicted AAA+ superfamily ATPase
MSTLLTRYLAESITDDLKEKMVFLGGPRQVGKTSLAQALLKNYQDGHPAYLNWDNTDHKIKIKTGNWPRSEKLIIFDEVHKYKQWRNLIKGFYDTLKKTHRFLVTGSAKLDHFRRGGDSLLGRYHYYRLHPLSLAELGYASNCIEDLLKFGGFPEPFFKRSESALRKWHNQRLTRIVSEDLRDLSSVREIDKIQLLAESLPERVGNPLSTKSLANDLEVDFKTVRTWLSLLDALYFSYQIMPYGSPKIRAVKKEQKLYLWDWSMIEPIGPKFENFVASHLLKYCHFEQDSKGYRMELQFIRDTDKREIDFVVLRDKKPIFAVECKAGEKSLSPHIPYFRDRTSIPKFYQVHLGKTSRQVDEKIAILPFEVFSREVGLV